MKISKLQTQDLHGYSVKFSPNFSPDYLACVASTNYGLSGPSHLFVFENVDRDYVPTYKCSWSDAIFDLTWKSSSNDIIVTGSGDGKIEVWPYRTQDHPCAVICAHMREVSSVEWCRLGVEATVLSASWDGTIKLWDIYACKELGIFLGHKTMVYEAAWSPHLCTVFASVGADKNIRLWDSRQPDKLSQKIVGHESDVLSIDWSILDEHLIATGSVDNTIKGWDLRRPDLPIFQIIGHSAAIRRVKFSPFQKDILISAGYDFTTRIWDFTTTDLLYINEEHTEFVYGLDCSPCIPNKVADCSWDGQIHVYENMELLL